MLLIPHSIRQKELKKTEKYFSEADIIKMAKKVERGLGIILNRINERFFMKIIILSRKI